MAVPALSEQQQQERCDRLYQQVASARWREFEGMTSQQVADWLGRPDRVMTLTRDGVTWMRIVYVCDRLPAGASAEERDAHGKGWRFSPSLLLRNGVVVPEDRFEREVPSPGRTAAQSPATMFREGGQFP